MTGVCLTADIDRWATPRARSAAPPAQYSLTDHTRARLGPSRPSETAAWGPSKLMRITAGGCRPAACFGGPLHLLAGCSAVYKDITSSVGTDWGIKQEVHVQELARKRKCLLWLHCAVLLEIALSGLEHRRVWGACGTKQHS